MVAGGLPDKSVSDSLLQNPLPPLLKATVSARTGIIVAGRRQRFLPRVFVRIHEEHSMYTRRPGLRGTSCGLARRAGAACVEFTVAGLVFFILILGTFEIGRALTVQHLLTNAAREGCRVGVLQGKSSTQITT